MSGQSVSSVRELLGKFEENSQRVSPPSRGRSPAGSESAGSRPFSKVRTSFVSVERSGQMAPALRKLSNNLEGDLGGDGQADPEPSMNNTDTDMSMANGNGILPHSTKDTTDPLARVKEEDAPSEPREPTDTNTVALEVPGCSNTAAIDSDKPVSAVENDEAALLPADPKDEKALSGGGALLQKRTSLGDLLKGHAFEQEDTTTPETAELETPKAQEPANPSKFPSPPKTQLTPLKVNGVRPVEASSASATYGKATSTRPPAIVTKKDTPQVPSAPIAASAVITNKSPKTSNLPKDASTSRKQPSSKTASPKPAVSSKPTSKIVENQPKQAPAQRSSRPSAVSKAPVATTTKSSQPPTSTHINPTKKTGPVSPSSKIHPKSPTRPVRLPASLTAPTAASVARLGGLPPARSPSRNSTTNANKPSSLNKDRTLAATSQIRSNTARASLPVPSAAPPKPKARTSIGGSKPADGGFLARMMRPTQSSASKTHEKVEPKTPPKKAIPNRLHKASEGPGEHGAHNSGEGNLVPQQDFAEPSHIQNSDSAQDGINVDANGGSVALPKASGTKGEEPGINVNGAAPSEAVSA